MSSCRRSRSRRRSEDFFPGVYNNKENADVYVSPFVEHRDTSNNNIREREQSLTLEVRNFQPGHTGRVYTPFLHDQDYIGYAAFEFWLNSTLPAGATPSSSCASARMRTSIRPTTTSTASRCRRPRRRAARQLAADQDRAHGSERPEGAATAGGHGLERAPRRRTVSIQGHPYLTKVRRITLGLSHSGTAPIESGSVWIDELRLTDVNQDVDVAYRFQVRTELADIGRIDFSYKHVGAEFTSLSGGGIEQSKEEQTSYSL